ncbi:MAG: patatin [Gaiellales bacterium]
MTGRSPLWWLLAAIAAATIASGLAQMVRPSLILGLIGGDTAPSALHFFGIVGMFMALFGGALLQALLSSTPQPIVVFWAALQKIGACVAVGIGVGRGIFGSLALAVAGFDLVSGLLAFWYWRGIRGAAQ